MRLGIAVSAAIFAPRTVRANVTTVACDLAVAAGNGRNLNVQLRRRALLAAALVTIAGLPAAAQTPEEFYKGKTIDFVIGYPPGGSNDVWGRIMTRHIGKHIPGKPAVVPKNMPGAGSFLAINQVFNVLPKDGTIIAIGAPTAALDERLGSQGVRFKTAQLNWIGRVDSLVNMVFMWKTSPVQTIAQAQQKEATLSGTGAGSTVSVYPTVLNNVIGTKFKLIMGYKGSSEAMLAVERGEVEGHSTSWTALKVAHPDWLRDKSVRLLVQFALKRHPEMADIPTAVELGRSDEERAVLAAVMNASEVGTAFFTTPGVPADRLEALRRAFDATMKDPEFLAEVQKTRLAVNPIRGEELQKLVVEVASLSPAIIDKVRAAYTMPK
jgi:tripartite-type tricarboxylate transporter receptor subunit TctC